MNVRVAASPAPDTPCSLETRTRIPPPPPRPASPPGTVAGLGCCGPRQLGDGAVRVSRVGDSHRRVDPHAQIGDRGEIVVVVHETAFGSFDVVFGQAIGNVAEAEWDGAGLKRLGVERYC